MRHRRSSQAWWEMAFEKPFARWLRGRQTCERGNDGIIAQDDALKQPERRPVRYALYMLRLCVMKFVLQDPRVIHYAGLPPSEIASRKTAFRQVRCEADILWLNLPSEAKKCICRHVRTPRRNPLV